MLLDAQQIPRTRRERILAAAFLIMRPAAILLRRARKGQARLAAAMHETRRLEASRITARYDFPHDTPRKELTDFVGKHSR